MSGMESATAISSQPGPAVNRGAALRANVATWLVFFLIVFMAFGPLITFGKPPPFSGDGNPLRQVVYAAILLAALFCRLDKQNLLPLIPVPVTLALALLWCWISISWSMTPDIGARRLILTTSIIWTIFLIVPCAGYQASVNAIRNAAVLVMALNFATVFLLPMRGIEQLSEMSDDSIVGSWRGMMGSKNSAGPFCAYALIFFTLDAKGGNKWFRICFALATAYFLYRTNSKTSIGLVVVAIAIGWLYARYKTKYLSVALFGIVLVLGTAIALIVLNYDAIERYFMDPTAFTGRTQIWGALVAYCKDHFWTGAGYGSFWNVGQYSPIFDYNHSWVSRNITEGHSGYLDIAAQIGVLGAIFAVFATFLWPIARLLKSGNPAGSRGGLLMACIFFAITHNFTETSLFERDAVPQVFVIIAIALIGSDQRAKSKAPNFPEYSTRSGQLGAYRRGSERTA